jgi:predicted amidohydrolase
MRLLLTALTCPKGEIGTNLARHLELVEEGRDAGCDLVLLPEMSLTGYRPSAAVSLDHPAVDSLVQATAGGPSLCFGLVETDGAGATAGRPFITQLLASDGDVVAVHRKAGLGTDEEAHFSRGRASEPVAVAGVSASLAVCAEIGTDPPYGQTSTLVLGPAAPGLYGPRRRTDEDWRRGYDWWRGSVTADAARLLGPNRWLAVSTQAGATDDEDFPGWAALLGPGGRVLAELPDWRPGTLVVEVPPG